jgi:hypothetical protein
MESRVLFKKTEQRKFLVLAIAKLNCSSLRGLLQFGFNISYSSLKNYFTERRLLPENFYDNLCYIAKIDKSLFKIKFLKQNWGQVKGGKTK